MKKLLVFLIVAAVILVGGGIALGVYFNSPEYVLSHSLSDAVKDLGERNEIKPLINVLSGGSMEFSVKDLDEYLGSSGVSASGKIYFSKDAVMLEKFKAESDEYDEIRFDAYFSKNLSYITNKEILDGTYGIIQGEMASAFEDSIFAFGADSNVAIPSKEVHELIVKLLEIYDDKKEFDSLSKDFEKLVKKYSSELKKAIYKYGEFESEWDNVRIDGERISARVVTLTLDGDACADIMNAVYKKARKDKDLYKFVEKISDKIGEIEDETLIEAFEENFIDDKEGDIEKAIKEMSKSKDEYTIKVVTPKFSTKLLKLSIVKESGKDETEFSIDIGKKGIKKTDKVTVSVNGDRVAYEIRKNTKDSYKAAIKTGGKDVIVIDVNKKRGKYTVEILESDATVSGKFRSDKKAITITVEKIEIEHPTVYGEENKIVFDVDITFILKEKDKMPKPLSKNKVTNVLDIDMDDIEKWIINVGEIIGDNEIAVEYGFIKPATDINVARNNLEKAGYDVEIVNANEISSLVYDNIYGNHVNKVLIATNGTYHDEASIRIAYYKSEQDALNAIDYVRNKFSYVRHVKLSGNMIYIGSTDAIVASAGK